jgi:hydrogenase-4 membrane subunit HyfE
MLSNIGPRETRKRRIVGWVALACGVAAAAVLLAAGAPRWARLGVALPFWAAALGLLQAREKV